MFLLVLLPSSLCDSLYCLKENVNEGQSYNIGNRDFYISNCFFSRSSLFFGNGGVIYCENAISFKIMSSVFNHCSVSDTGGAIYSQSTGSTYELSMICCFGCYAGQGSFCFIEDLKNSNFNHKLNSVSGTSDEKSRDQQDLTLNNLLIENLNSSNNIHHYSEVQFIGGTFIGKFCSFSSNNCYHVIHCESKNCDVLSSNWRIVNNINQQCLFSIPEGHCFRLYDSQIFNSSNYFRLFRLEGHLEIFDSYIDPLLMNFSSISYQNCISSYVVTYYTHYSTAYCEAIKIYHPSPTPFLLCIEEREVCGPSYKNVFSDLNISNCHFHRIHHFFGEGGVIYIAYTVNSYINECVFSNCSVSKNGGAIFYDSYCGLYSHIKVCSFLCHANRGQFICFINGHRTNFILNLCMISNMKPDGGESVQFSSLGDIEQTNFSKNKGSSLVSIDENRFCLRYITIADNSDLSSIIYSKNEILSISFSNIVRNVCINMFLGEELKTIHVNNSMLFDNSFPNFSNQYIIHFYNSYLSNESYIKPAHAENNSIGYFPTLNIDHYIGCLSIFETQNQKVTPSKFYYLIIAIFPLIGFFAFIKIKSTRTIDLSVVFEESESYSSLHGDISRLELLV